MSLPTLRSCTRDKLVCVHIMSYGIDQDGNAVTLPQLGAHFHQVWVERRGNHSDEIRAEAWEFKREFYDHQLEEARAYAWQLAAKYQLEVDEYDGD